MKKYIVLLKVLLCINVVWAGNTLGKKVLMAPKAYDTPTGAIESSDCERHKEATQNNVWIVFSDRSNNPTYFESKSSSPTMKKMNYMDAFFVIGDEGDFLHLVKYEMDPSVLHEYKITRNLDDYGWAPKDKLLLWANGLTHPVTKFTIKALSINPPESLNNIASYAKGNALKIFNDPDLTEKNENEVKLFDFLFVFKRSEKSVLIGGVDKLNRLSAKYASRRIYGWVDKKVINEWKDRVTMEPNWMPEAVAERKNKNIKASIFITQDAAEQFKSSGDVKAKDVLWDNDSYQDRKLPEWKRLPYLGPGPTPDVFRTGAVTGVFNKDNQEVIKEDEQTLIERAYGELRKSYRNVNVIFVVDGSEVMVDYYANILNTLMNTANSLQKATDAVSEEDASANNYKMGLVVYRDYGDKGCGRGIEDFQEKALTTNYTDIVDYFQNEVKFGSCNKGGTTPRRALYAGLMKAVKQLQDAEKQTNVVILIGAGPNRGMDNKVDYELLVNQMAKYRVGLLAFQAKHPADPAYDDFHVQLFDILQATTRKYQSKLAKDFPDRKFSEAELEPESNNLYKFDCPKKSPIPGGIMISDALNHIKPEELSAQVKTMFDELTEATENIIDGMNSKLKGQGVRTDMNEGMFAFLSLMKVDLELLRVSSFDNIQLFVEGYTTKTCDKLNNPLYKICLLLSYRELSSLIIDLQSITDPAASKTEDRKRIKAAFEAMLASRLGPKEVKKRMATLTPGQLVGLLTGLESKSPLLNEFKLDDVTKERVVSDEKLEQIRYEISSKIEALEKYRKASTVNGFNVADELYFWLPDHLLP